MSDIFVRFSIKLEVHKSFFLKASNIKFHGNPPSRNRADNMQTDGQTWRR